MPRRGHRERDYLFHEYDFMASTHTLKEKLKQEIDKALPDAVSKGTVDEAAAPFVANFRAEVPELIEGAISVAT